MDQDFLTNERQLRLECYKATNNFKRADALYHYVISGKVPENEPDTDPGKVDLQLVASPRLWHCLYSIGIKTLGDVTECRRNEIIRLRGMGAKTFQELSDMLKMHNLTFADD